MANKMMLNSVGSVKQVEFITTQDNSFISINDENNSTTKKLLQSSYQESTPIQSKASFLDQHHRNDKRKLVNKKNMRKNSYKSTNESDDFDSDNDMLPNRSHKYSKRNKKKISAKKHGLRHQNFCYMLNMVYGDSITDDEFEFEENDHLIDKESPFSKLTLSETNLQIWLDFLSKSGQEQEDFLKENNVNEYKRNGKENTHSYFINLSQNSINSNDSESEIINEEHWKISQHYFNRIDRNIREAMKKPISVDCIEKYENQVLNAFTRSQEHIINNIVCSFERLIIHGLCQFFDAKSKTFENGDSKSMVLKCVKNFESKKPPISLSHFLKRKFLEKSYH